MKSQICTLLLVSSVLAAQQKLDEAYTAKIREFTTDKMFLTELVDHLPDGGKVPSPEKVLGYIVGTPNKLTHSSDVNRYFRALAAASPRVKVFTMGQTEEGREMIVVCISNEENLAKLNRHKELMAKLADPRKTPPAEAQAAMKEVVPMYWLTGSLHSPETGSPEMLMELGYRLAVENSDLINTIRKDMIVMITPVSEVDGREKMVDLYNWKRAHEGQAAPSLLYWGKYVAHDNNRDAMNLALALTRNVWKTYYDFHPLVMHDLHESVPFLYVSTGMGPYNAWYDPILISEWQKMAYHEVEELTKRGVPGVWTHGFYDGWAANYMFVAANGHNSIGRFYETFGNGGADTRKRTVPSASTTRAWFRPNPPLPEVNWSLRNNVNLQQSGVLLALGYTARNKMEFLNNFYLKGQRSVAKATTEGPAAYIVPGDTLRPALAADLMRIMDAQGVEVHKLDAATEITTKAGKRSFPAGSYVVRMDQPYSRLADMLLDLQYYNVNDPAPYDDTGWSLGYLRNIETARVTDAAILKAPMTMVPMVNGVPQLSTSVSGAGTAKAWIVPNTADMGLATFRFALKDVKMWSAEGPFEVAGVKFGAGAVIIPADGVSQSQIAEAAKGMGLKITAVDAVPGVARHELAAPRIALVHTWTNTQNEGWFRVAMDTSNVPFDYISDQKLGQIADLRAKYDVIILGPVGGSSQRIVNGIPKRDGEPPMPWKKSELTPNFATSPDQTDDMRGGMGLEGILNLRRFVEAGGLFITIGSNASIPIDYGLVEGVSITPARELQVRGSVLMSTVSDKLSPIMYGYDDKTPVYFNSAPILQVSTPGGGFGGGGGGRAPGTAAPARPTGRGGPNDTDIVQGRVNIEPVKPPALRPGEEPPMSDEIREAMRAYIAPEAMAPRVVLKFAAEPELLISGMLAGGRELATKPAVVDVPLGKGHVVMFAINPMWRQQTQGSWAMIFNAAMNFANLGAGRVVKKVTVNESGGPRVIADEQ